MIKPRMEGAAMIGAVAAMICCNPNVIKPKPIATVPMRPSVLFSFDLNSTIPTKINKGESQDKSKESTTAIRLVPISAPSMTEGPAHKTTNPVQTKDEMITAGAVLDRTDLVTAIPATTGLKRLLRLFASTRRRCSPNIRTTQVHTILVPQTRIAIGTSKFSKWIIG